MLAHLRRTILIQLNSIVLFQHSLSPKKKKIEKKEVKTQGTEKAEVD